MIETPVGTDEPGDDSAVGVAAQQQDGCDQLDETPEGDISTLTSLCGDAEFTELIVEMVADEAPRLFAVVQEYGERVDGRIAAWGMAFEDHAKVVSINDRTTMSLRSPERAAHRFSSRPNITARVVWVNPDATPRATRPSSSQTTIGSRMSSRVWPQ